MLVSGVQQSESVTHKRITMLLLDSFSTQVIRVLKRIPCTIQYAIIFYLF